MLTGVHHVGVIESDHKRALGFFVDVFDGTIEQTVEVNDRVIVTFVALPGLRIELITRRERGSDLDGILDELLAVSPSHIAFTVDDIDQAMATLKAAGYRMHDLTAVDGVGPYLRAFLHPADVPGIPVELVEPER